VNPSRPTLYRAWFRGNRTVTPRPRVEHAIHNNEMEGLHVNADTLADASEYIAGRIDSDELVARARARYRLA
jgi:hypothetical protein